MVFSTVKVNAKFGEIIIGSKPGIGNVWSDPFLLEWDRFIRDQPRI
jgi:hypothetical protein